MREMDKIKKVFLICLMVVMTGFFVGSLFVLRDYDKRVTLKRAKSLAEEFQGGIINIIERRAGLQVRLKEYGIDFEKCFLPSDSGLTRLIPVNSPLFQKKTTEKLLWPRKFVRMSPVFMTAENINNCRSCHRHKDIKVGEPIGAIVTTIEVGYIATIEEYWEFIRSFFF